MDSVSTDLMKIKERFKVAPHIGINKYLLILILLGCLMSSGSLFAQRHGFGLKAGILDVQTNPQVGPSVEFGYSYQLFEHDPWLERMHLQLHFGGAWLSNFSEEWNINQDRVNLVPRSIHTEFLNTPAASASDIHYEQYAYHYFQLQMAYYIVQSNSWRLGPTGGIMYLSTHTNIFTLDDWTTDPRTGNIADYTPRYRITIHPGMAASLGFEVQYLIGKAWALSVDFRYNVLIEREEVLNTPEFNLIRLGIAKRFGRPTYVP